LVALGAPAQAAGPDFVASAGVYTVDTTALTFTGPGANFTGTASGSTATFSFNSINIPSGATVNVHGSRTFTLVATGGLTVGGLIDGSGGSATDQVSTAVAGGPGGGAGGAAGELGGGAGGGPGGGPGGGGAPVNSNDGAGGGGFGGSGARGGGSGGAGGAAYGNLNVTLQAGSGGGGGAITTGGGGGGGIALVGANVTVGATGVVRVDGGGGGVGGGGASGAGSGGGILVHAATLNVAGVLSAKGGDGGAGGCCGDGGGGGGGRIALQYQTLISPGTDIAAGGSSGTRSTIGGFSHGTVSLDATGASGAVTLTSAPDTVITSAKIKSARHKATFSFAAVGSGTSFQCMLKKPHKAATFKSCTSPKTYKHLKHGRYKFSVRAVGLAGADLTPATKRFRIH